MFDFRIIDTPDGNQIIDRNLKTPYNALTPLQMVEYLEMDNRLAYMDWMERKARVYSCIRWRSSIRIALSGKSYIKC